MSTYQGRRNSDTDNGDVSASSAREQQKQQEQDSTKKLTKTAAKGAATYFGGPEAGQAVEMASKTKVGDQVLNKGSEALGKVPGIKQASKKLDDMGVIDAADKALDIAGGNVGQGVGKQAAGGAANQAANQAGNQAGKNLNVDTGIKKGGPGNKTVDDAPDVGPNNDKTRGPLGKKKDDKENEDREKDNRDGSEAKGEGQIPEIAKIAIIAFAPFFLIILIVVAIFSTVEGSTGNYNDALGVSEATGGQTGGISYKSGDKNADEFYNRVKDVVDEYGKDGKQVDPILIAAVYHTINYHNGSYGYKTMTKDKIREIADAMFDDESNMYSEETFTNNLKNKILKSYFPTASDTTIDGYVQEIMSYKKQYYELIGYSDVSACGPSGTCNYAIKGFYIYGKGNVAKNVTYTNLKVRLMQSGVANGHNYGGTFGQPLEGEDLVPFEKYVLGVAYAEVGTGYPEEAIKAQMVAARSYALARPVDMHGWRTITQNGDGYVLQAANSTQDQVYCDPDKGCSSNNGQWGMIHSGQGYNSGYSKPALAANARIRTLANETEGEVLVNSQGYIIYTTFTDVQQKQMKALANQGYNYKQILLSIYNSSQKPFGAASVEKMSCSNSDSTCASGVTGDYASWKQYEGPWIGINLGNTSRTIKSDGCLVTAVAMQIARSGVETNVEGEFNPGTFVQFLNKNGGFDGASLKYAPISLAAPRFKYVNSVDVSGYSKEGKLQYLADLINKGYYVVAEVKGTTGQHWVAPVSISNGTITMMDAGSKSTDMWTEYYWGNTSRFVYFKVD